MDKGKDILALANSAPLPVGEGLGVGERGAASRPAIDVAHPHPTLPLEGVGFSSAVSGEVDFDQQGCQNAIRVGEDIVVPVTDDMVSMRLDHSGAGFVSSAVSVLAAIEFDDELQSAAGKVRDRVSNRKLAREFDTKLFAFKPRPNSFFRFRRIFAQLARKRRQAFIAHTSCTPTQLSPMRGRALIAKSA